MGVSPTLTVVIDTFSRYEGTSALPFLPQLPPDHEEPKGWDAVQGWNTYVPTWCGILRLTSKRAKGLKRLFPSESVIQKPHIGRACLLSLSVTCAGIQFDLL